MLSIKNSVAILLLPFAVNLYAENVSPHNWYREAVVVLHNDNHCSLLAQGHSADEIYGWIKDLPVSSVQVSAYGALGNRVTYPSKAVSELNYPDLGNWDTLAVWREATLKAGKRFNVYLNTRGFKIHERHPHWMQQDSEGRGKGRGPELFDCCARPALDGDSYLEKILLPMITEISGIYKPDAFWVDGDHARTQCCYCKNCVAAWKELTGKDKAPAGKDDPDWGRWLQLEQERYDAYRIKMAQAAHAVNPSIMYASNHSWHKMMGESWVKHDPRSAPDEMDYYTADLSHGQSLKQTRIYALLLSAEEEIPYDIMHSVYSPDVSLTRIMQEGGVTMSSGATWNLWISGSTITEKEARNRAQFCACFADSRKTALGYTLSLNQSAVLSSESSWLEQREAGKEGFYHPDAVKNAALALQDSGYSVDIINEHMLINRLDKYRTLVVNGQLAVSTEAINKIRAFVSNGGHLLVSGSPQLSGMKGGNVLHCDLSGLRYPDSSGMMAKCMKSAGHEPEVRVTSSLLNFQHSREGCPPDSHDHLETGLPVYSNKNHPHLIYSFRKKVNSTVLHVTDITSYIDGRKVFPDKSEIIDPQFNIYESLSIEIASPVEPEAVHSATTEEISYKWNSRVKSISKAFPEELQCLLPKTQIEHSWTNGILTLTIKGFCTHDAIIIDNGGALPAPLPSGTKPEDHLSYLHYGELNILKSDFERELHGHLRNPLGIFSLSDRYKKQIHLSEQHPASGKSCLEFHSDGDSSPYIYTQPAGFDRGTGVLNLDLRIEKGAMPWIDFRETSSRKTHPVGPSIRVNNGRLIADGHKPLCDFKENLWHHLEIRFPLDRKGVYSLTVTPPSGEERVFDNLPYVSGNKFQKCGWIGIVNTNKKESGFAIDNFELELVTE